MAERLKIKKSRDPERSRLKILLNAEKQFAEKGPAVSVDTIASASKLNKRMIYHYFGSKDGLWQAVLSRQYEKVAQVEANLPESGKLSDIVSVLIERYYRFLAEDSAFVKILMYENMRGDLSIRDLPIAQTKFPLLETLESTLRANPIEGVDTTNLLIDCLALCFFYFSNQATLSVLFGENLADEEKVEMRIKHVKEIVRIITRKR
jgi:TetR/AcrR family transcriptional regulator